MKRGNAILLQASAAVLTVVLLIMIITSPPPVADAEADDHRCYECTPYTNDCNQCDTGRCCSPSTYCGSSYRYCTECYCGADICDPCNCLGNCPPPDNENQQQLPSGYGADRNATTYPGTAPNRDDGKKLLLVATYEPELDRVSSDVRNISSSVGNRERGYAQYGSAAAICTNNISSNIVPGQCLQVSNPENGKQAMVRITKKIYCVNASLALDYQVFQHLGNGNPPGHQLPISYNYVQCIET